jgi:hypothetical protein
MRQYQFGRIENLRVVAGQPILRPDTRIVRVARINGSGDIPEVSIHGESELKPAVRDLFGHLKKLSSAIALRLEFRHGLPCLLETEAEVGAKWPLTKQLLDHLQPAPPSGLWPSLPR